MGQDYSILGQASPPDTTGNASTTGNNLICDGSHWQYPAIITGSISAGGTAISCGTGTAGAIEWTGSALQYCNGTGWAALGGGGSLSGGTANYDARWTSSTALGIGAVYDTGSLVSIGTTTTTSMLGVYGGLSIGTTYVSTAAPTNGAIIQGNVGIGTTSPGTPLDVNGNITDRSVTSCAQIGTNSSGQLVCNTPALTLISTLTASTSASLQFTSLPTTYNTLFINCAGLIASGANILLYARVGEGAGPTWETGAHYVTAGTFTGVSSNGLVQTSTATDLLQSDYTNTSPANLKLYLDNNASSTIYKNITYLATLYDTSTANPYQQTVSGYWGNDKNAITAFELVPASGTIKSGTCSLYGMN